MTQWSIDVQPVMVSAADPFPLDDAPLLELCQDPLHGTLRDTDSSRDIPDPSLRISGQNEGDVSVVREKSPTMFCLGHLDPRNLVRKCASEPTAETGFGTTESPNNLSVFFYVIFFFGNRFPAIQFMLCTSARGEERLRHAVRVECRP